jgi:hypothetical protein
MDSKLHLLPRQTKLAAILLVTIGSAQLKAFLTRSGVIGVSRRRLPVNTANALLIAGATRGVAI